MVNDEKLGGDGLTWPQTMDAVVWADIFCAKFQFSASNRESMVGWFSNAIMAGYDAGCRRTIKDMTEPKDN